MMSENSTVFVSAVNLGSRLAALESGDIVEITNLFDSDGNDCDPDDAITAVAEFAGRWIVIDLRDFGVATLN